jgi:branched-chain amino acid aminotransferase
MPPTKALDWKNLGFQYLPTNGQIQIDYEDGKWGPIQVKREAYIPMHVAANCLHYGQACFEGLKAFTTKTGKIVIFRPNRNAERMQQSADRLMMQAPPTELFVTACRQAVEINREFVPPYGTGASMYLRPLLIGTEPAVGVKPSSTYSFIVLVTPVGPYYKDGFKPLEALVMEDYDRAAPKGTGRAKMAGNYAASLRPGDEAKQKGFPIVLYPDPKENKYVDEFGSSNFFGITHEGEYKTPDSESILPSITNESLQILAKDMGLKVIKEPILLSSLDQFKEVGACGTAVVITPIHAVHHGSKKFIFGEPNQAGETLLRLFNAFQAIQYGDAPDLHGWLTPVP